MLVMFSPNHVLLLALIDSDVAKMDEGKTLTYINPPHGPQLIRDIIIFRGKDKDDVLKQISAAGVDITEADVKMYKRGERTDRPAKDN